MEKRVVFKGCSVRLTNAITRRDKGSTVYYSHKEYPTCSENPSLSSLPRRRSAGTAYSEDDYDVYALFYKVYVGRRIPAERNKRPVPVPCLARTINMYWEKFRLSATD